ncbi:uncharacterized protein LOC125723606 [Brienomyrus brachyistius]|uniref:uncharacterized protein LOC125723606 n=1 Tax=Brienomyrus brachyistius TaxID=42636 RepID=UPI0020B292C6|nr:uncharacterized protein LOC125723606 [Brienomyrus brachyistius]
MPAAVFTGFLCIPPSLRLPGVATFQERGNEWHPLSPPPLALPSHHPPAHRGLRPLFLPPSPTLATDVCPLPAELGSTVPRTRRSGSTHPHTRPPLLRFPSMTVWLYGVPAGLRSWVGPFGSAL